MPATMVEERARTRRSPSSNGRRTRATTVDQKLHQKPQNFKIVTAVVLVALAIVLLRGSTIVTAVALVALAIALLRGLCILVHIVSPGSWLARPSHTQGILSTSDPEALKEFAEEKKSQLAEIAIVAAIFATIGKEGMADEDLTHVMKLAYMAAFNLGIVCILAGVILTSAINSVAVGKVDQKRFFEYMVLWIDVPAGSLVLQCIALMSASYGEAMKLLPTADGIITMTYAMVSVAVFLAWLYTSVILDSLLESTPLGVIK